MQNLRGILLMVLSMAGFAVSDGFLKAALATVPQGQFLLLFGLGASALLCLASKAAGHPLTGPWLARPLFLTRFAADALAVAAVVSAFALAPLSLVSAIMQVSPLVAALAAVLILGERLGIRRIAAIAAGLLGVMIIIAASNTESGASTAQHGGTLGAILAFIGAALLAVRDVLTRAMPADIPSMSLVTYGFIAIIPSGLLTLAVVPGWTPIDLAEAALIVATILSGIFGYTMVTLAARSGEITILAPFRYTRLVFALLIGGLVFGERLSAIQLLGAAIVIGSGLFVFWREARAKSA